MCLLNREAKNRNIIEMIAGLAYNLAHPGVAIIAVPAQEPDEIGHV